MRFFGLDFIFSSLKSCFTLNYSYNRIFLICLPLGILQFYTFAP